MAAKKKSTATGTPSRTADTSSKPQAETPVPVPSKRKATEEVPSSVMTPTKKRVPKNPADRAPDVSIHLAPGTDVFVERAEVLDDWKGRVTMMWGQLFFVQRHLSTDQPSPPSDKTKPSVLLASHKPDMYTYFERSFVGHQNWFRNKMKLFGDQWLNSECGQAWRRQITGAEASLVDTANTKFESPESPSDPAT